MGIVTPAKCLYMLSGVIRLVDYHIILFYDVLQINTVLVRNYMLKSEYNIKINNI